MNVKPTFADRVFNGINAMIMVVLLFLFAYPLYYVLLASFTHPNEVLTGKMLFYPTQLYMEGYRSAFSYRPIWTGYANTVFYTVVGVMMSMMLTVPTAYALSRGDMAFRKPLMLLFSFTMFFGGGLIPTYLLIKELGIYDTRWVMLLPSAVSVWNLIICRTYFQSTINNELLEAAQIDGCTDFRFFFSIALPLSTTIITTLVMMYASAKWNAYFEAMVYIRDTSKYPLQLVLRELLMSVKAIDIIDDAESYQARQQLVSQMKYCIIVLALLPMMIAYPFMQKGFVRGMMIGSLKG